MEQLRGLITKNEKLVLNIEASWCPDCTVRQRPHLAKFSKSLENAGIAFYRLIVQEKRGVFISDEYQAFVDSMGGHGYPRTVLFLRGDIASTNHIERIVEQQLDELAEKFIAFKMR